MKSLILTGAYFASSSAMDENYTVKEEHRESVVFDRVKGKWKCSCNERNCRHIQIAMTVAQAEGRGKVTKKR